MNGLGWGVVGTGVVAEQFARALGRVPNARRRAVVSARPERARCFAARHGFDAAHDDIEQLLADRDVDIVYVASPSRLHRAHGLATIAAGKALVCEKPFGASAADAEAIAAAARAAGCFCMEAMWLRFAEPIVTLRNTIAEGAIGQPVSAAISIGYAKCGDKLGTPDDARGALPVFGCYALSLGYNLFGPPGAVRSLVRLNDADVETDAAALVDFGGVTVSIDASVRATRTNRLDIVGTEALATIPSNLIDPVQLVLRRIGTSGARSAMQDALLPLDARLPAARRRKGSGMRGEIREAMRCVRVGLTESPQMPLAETIAVHRLIEAIRRDERS